MAPPVEPRAFLGRWRIERVILDRKGPDARFLGRADICEGDPWLYAEEGEMRMGTARFAASRRYLWQPAGDGVAIAFEDGRPFHTLPLDGGRSGHWCDPDQYDVAYDFDQWPRWHVTWNVTGPRKDYCMESTYLPLAEG